MTRDEFLAWKKSELTEAVFALLNEEVTNIVENWKRFNYKSELENAKQIGIIEGINKVLFMEVEDGE